MVIDASRQNAETLYFPLRCVDGIRGKALSTVFYSFLSVLQSHFLRCVDLVSETLTGQRLPDELPTDWVKSD